MRVGLLIVGILLLIVGFVLASLASTMLGECQSAMGKISSFFSPSYSSQCSSASFLLVIGYGILLAGGILFILSLVLRKKMQNHIEDKHSYGNKGKFCGECGSKLKGHEKHCPECGAKI